MLTCLVDGQAPPWHRNTKVCNRKRKNCFIRKRPLILIPLVPKQFGTPDRKEVTNTNNWMTVPWLFLLAAAREEPWGFPQPEQNPAEQGSWGWDWSQTPRRNTLGIQRGYWSPAQGTLAAPSTLGISSFQAGSGGLQGSGCLWGWGQRGTVRDQLTLSYWPHTSQEHQTFRTRGKKDEIWKERGGQESGL